MDLPQRPGRLPGARREPGAEATLPPTPPAPEGVRPTEKGPRRAGLLLVATGVLLLVLAAGDALVGASALCSAVEPTTRCAARAGASASSGWAGDKLRGLSGDDELYGEPGRDALLGGAGDDSVEDSDGEPDRVACGPGQDTANLNAGDRLAPAARRSTPVDTPRGG